MNVILEIGTEEIPADYLTPAINNIRENAEKILLEKRIKYASIETYFTVRRFVLFIKDTAGMQEDLSFEKKGPKYDIAYKDGVLTDVGKNFFEKAGLSEKDAKITEENGKKFIYISVFEKGRPSKEVLAEIFPQIINAVKFPKTMTWDASGVTFARPVRWITALFGSEVINFTWGNVKSGNKTRLHKFEHSNKEEVVSSADAYFDVMKKAGIIIRQDEREKEIADKAREILKSKGMIILPDKVLLEKLAQSVETVKVVAGEFDKRFLFLPKEVIITAMREHQRYFAVTKDNGEFTNYFVNVRDGGDGNNDFVTQRHGKVLFARLKDAEFFYQEDLKKPIEDNLPKLKEAIFITGLGTMFQKVERLTSIAAMSDTLFGYDNPELLSQAARFSKADLVTDMVSEKEYVSLRGFMGGVYFHKQGKPEKICKAVAEQYYPNFVGDALPSTKEGLLLSLVDKIDNICGFFIAGFKPTGSKDPYAVRRQALTAIYIILEKTLDINLSRVISAVMDEYRSKLGKSCDEKELLDFFRQRELNYFKDRNIDYDIINALPKEDGLNLLDDYEKALVLSGARKRPRFNEIIFTLSRVNNIIPEGFKPGETDTALFDAEEEKKLYARFYTVKEKMTRMLDIKDFGGAYETIASIKLEIDAYFEKVLVNDKNNEKASINRLNMLSEISSWMKLFADFREIVVDRKQ
ncbi:MAG: glycine--tRNA ligase subunit beta [Candidatus Goldiibacteriota bacterium HGW-Goldbacteria-1]|jgi:glycyl-tRNA synthetase beta chain|nr:MAG: glycine--tRNA ligase subunit beta [Candidatus Goldiibacteriota bacterium HGW-Goldbacteria-1]